jgi:hypothetical protein
MNDDPEIGVAAGLDIPTAMALDDQPTYIPTKGGCWWAIVVGLALVILYSIVRTV